MPELYCVTTFSYEDRKIRVYEPVQLDQNTTSEAKIIFRGVMMIQAMTPFGPLGASEQEFDIEAENIAEAYNKFDQSFEEAKIKMKEEATKPKIVNPNEMPGDLPGMPGLNGPGGFKPRLMK